MSAIVQSLTPARRRARNLLVAGYVGVVGLGLLSDVQPRVFWTMLLPLRSEEHTSELQSR